MIVEKDILYPGSYTLPGGEVWTCSHGDVRNAFAQGNRMLASGNIAPPVIWGHDYASVPMPMPVLLSMIENPRKFAGDTAKNTFGYTKSFSLESQRGDPVLLASLEIPDPEAAKQFKTTRFVSPRVDHDHTDSNGRYWPGASIGHIAATPLPVQSRQRPVMLSADRRPGTSRTTVFLSLEYRKMADENKDKTGSNAMSRILTALSSMGHTIPDTVTDPDGLALALEVMAANAPATPAVDNDFDDDDMNDTDTPGPNDVESSVTPAMLSAMPIPARNALENSAKDSKANLLRRVSRVASVGVTRGVVSAAEINQIKAIIEGADTSKMLSMVGQGSAKSKAIFKLETYERACGIKPGATSKKPSDGGTVNLDRLQAVPAPTLDGNNPDEIAKAAERAKQRVAANRTA